MIIGALHIPQGAGRMNVTRVSGPGNSIFQKTSMVEIVNDDKMCLARAIGVCFARVHKIDSKEEWAEIKRNAGSSDNLGILIKQRKTSQSTYKTICKKTRKEQGTLAKILCEMAEVSADKPASLADVGKFEEALQVRIAVVGSSLGNKFVRVPDKTHPERPILYLYMTDHEGTSHFHSIVGITGFFRSVYFCETCFKYQ